MKSHRPWMPALVLGMFAVVGSAAGQQAQPLNFGNNFFVTGDYVVAGAYNMTSKFQTFGGISYAVGTINVPDSNPGITGVKKVPKGAQIVAALLYWQTVEKVGVTPGAVGSGQNAYIRPLLYSGSGGPAAPGYAIAGTNLTGSNTVSWSSGGCSGGSTGKLLRTYRADVGGALPLDANGNPTANGSFEVRIPSVGNSTPLTLGATLVVIYRIPSVPGAPVPLNSIVIYDGDYSQSNSQLTMTQPIQGFYDADQNTVSRLTHIVGSGQSNKFQNVYLGSTNPLTKLPLPYGNKLPAFPGYYGTWDNPTWTFTSGSPIPPDASLATTQVVPAASMQGCVSWGAVILSTTVKNSDQDGILDSWKTNQGYCDASVNNGSCSGRPGDPAWVDLTGAAIGQRDIFLQYDYMCSSISNGQCVTGGGNYSFDPRLAVDSATQKNAVDKVVDAFKYHTGSPKPFELYAVAGNAIAENQSAVTCTDTAQTGPTCPFPKVAGNAPGTVGFREGLTYIKNQNIDPSTGFLCTPGTTGCSSTPVFQHGKKDSYHYVMFSEGVALPNWFLADGSLTSVVQSGNTVTFTTASAHGIKPIAGDFCQYGRVSVVYAITNPNLEGTFCVKNVTPTTFAITVSGSANASYTAKTDPNLSVANGQVTSMSGFSDVGGQNSVISLGYGAWGPPSNPASDGNKWQVKAGTFMHELGHTLGLTHGGTFYPNLANNDYNPTFEVNCKPNVQSIMSYSFQVDLLEAKGQPNSQVVDFSEDALPTLSEGTPQGPNLLNGGTYAKTAWYQLTSYAGGTPQQGHCDGTALSGDPSTSYVSDFTQNFFWSTNNPNTGSDINFNGKSSDVMNGHDEWDGTVLGGVAPSPGVDLQQVSAVGTISTIGLGGEAGALRPAGGGGALRPAGGGGALRPAGGGGALRPAGGGGLTSDITHQTANSYARPPRSLTITEEEASPRVIDLSWTVPTFGQIVHYNVYRSDAGANGFGAFTPVGQAPGSQTKFTDTVTCNTYGGYRYRVTAVVNDDSTPPVQLESVPSNIIPAAGEPSLTGCYTSPVNVAVQATGVQGDIIPVTWSLTDDFYAAPPAAWSTATADNHNVTSLAANTNKISAIGPIPPTAAGACPASPPANPQTTLLFSAGFTANNNLFTFNWDTDAFNAGCYFLRLDLDSDQKFTSSALKLGIDINDRDTLRIPSETLAPGTVGQTYPPYALSEEGGTAPFAWSATGLPGGIDLQGTNTATPTISGTTCVAGQYQINASLTDGLGNSGAQVFTLNISKANTTTTVNSTANPSVFQQPVTFTVTVAAQGSCPPTGTVALSIDGTPSVQALTPSSPPGTANASFGPFNTLLVDSHSITANYSGNASFNGSNGALSPSQTVRKASTSISLNSVTPSPAFVGQPITVSYILSVDLPGLPSPTPPSGSVTVAASDGSSCVDSLGLGMCTLGPTPPSTAGQRTFTISYSGDGNFLSSQTPVAIYNVYQLVFTTQPSNTGAGLTIPQVVVTAQDFNKNNQPLTSFIGGVTLAKGAGPGTLTGGLTQNAVSGVATFSDLSINQVANGYTLTAAPAGGLVSATSNAFNVDTFYIDANGNFGTLDLATGTATQIGSATVPNSTGIDLTPGLQIYAYNTSNQLMQITPSPVGASLVGAGTGPTLATTGALTGGSYFGVDMAGNLYSIDLTNGATTQVGPQLAAPSPVPAGCTLDLSLTGSATVLYYIVGYNGTGCSPDTLYQIDTVNWTVTSGTPVTIAGKGAQGIVGSTWVGGTLYGFDGGAQEYTIDPSTGIATFLNPTRLNGTTAIVITAAGASK